MGEPMSMNEYHEFQNRAEYLRATLLRDLAKQCVEDSERWFGDSGKVNDIVHHSLGLAGETGEFIELVKKVDRGSYKLNDPAVRSRLGDELADVFIYVLNLAGVLGVDLLAEYNRKRTFNEERFSEQRREREANADLG